MPYEALAELPAILQDEGLMRHLFVTALLLFVVVGTRYVILRFLRRNDRITPQLQLRAAANIRVLSYLILAFGLFFIWAAELRALALSFVVLAMAIVWAIKETLTSVQGWFYRMSSDAFSVGDRIRVLDIHGDVIDHGLLSTTVLEVGPGYQRTGRVISLPNSVFLTAPILNESLAGEYVLHVMTIPVRRDAPLDAIEQRVLTAAREACAEFLDDVRRSIVVRYRRHGLNAPLSEPRITYEVVDTVRVNMLLRIPTPVGLVRKVEQRVLRSLLELPESDHAVDDAIHARTSWIP